MAKPPECVDCQADGISTYRPTPHGGVRSPLCVSHHRARKKARSARAHELRIEKQYELSSADYWGLYEFQNGVCFVCQRAKGISKRLAVEHDHDKAENECGHERDKGCRNCIRCLACAQCNELLGRYPVDALVRAIVALKHPPAQRYFRESANG